MVRCDRIVLVHLLATGLVVCISNFTLIAPTFDREGVRREGDFLVILNV